MPVGSSFAILCHWSKSKASIRGDSEGKQGSLGKLGVRVVAKIGMLVGGSP